MPLEVTRDDKNKKFKRDLVGVASIKKDCRVVENDLQPSRALVEFGVVGGDATTSNFGVSGGDGGYSPNVGDDFDGVDGGGGGEGFSPINEKVRCPTETPFTRGESSNVGAGTSKEPSYFFKCLKCTEKIDSLILKVQSLEDTVKILISKRVSSHHPRFSDPYTPDVVKRRSRVNGRRNGRQISKALTSAKIKVKNTPRVMASDQIEQELVP
ncbi:hypothetical protein HAX54_024619 [Datura stramonium]|uniref:Uncharacterized protein n=1 Tax=Datura stramonium TaxID=4076 RepID=A0ABS8RGX7_DATST|nr:hypothetical protein [Datura stramonium]